MSHVPAFLSLQLDLTASQLDDVCKVKVLDQHAHQRRKAAHITPAELILLPNGSTLGQLKTAVTDAFKTLYRLAQHWTCEQVLGLPDGALGPPKPAVAAAAAATAAAAGSSGGGAAAVAAVAAEDSRQLLGRVIERGCVLTAVGRGLDPEARWVVVPRASGQGGRGSSSRLWGIHSG
jgi:hypothetical protein